MKKQIFVINLKNILITIALFSILVIICLGGEVLVDNIIETASNNKLLPIYSVETIDKVVAITFDCAWSRSQ